MSGGEGFPKKREGTPPRILSFCNLHRRGGNLDRGESTAARKGRRREKKKTPSGKKGENLPEGTSEVAGLFKISGVKKGFGVNGSEKSRATRFRERLGILCKEGT